MQIKNKEELINQFLIFIQILSRKRATKCREIDKKYLFYILKNL
jgi:hypothetical protein